jgi:hypothetical protein
MLAALAHTARDLGVGVLLAASLFCLSGAAGILIDQCIRVSEMPEFMPSDEPKRAEDLDDWLARDEPDFDFEVHRQPEASVRMERRAA